MRRTCVREEKGVLQLCASEKLQNVRAFARVRSRTGSERRTSSYNSRLVRQSKVLFLATNVAGLAYRAQSTRQGVVSVSDRLSV